MGGMATAPNDGYTTAIKFNMDTVEGDKEAFATNIALFKHYAVGASLYQSFEVLKSTGKVPAG